jgi:hypothetical protein
MTTTSMTFGNTVRRALVAVLSATLLAACGGGDYNAEELDAAAATSQGDPSATPNVSFEREPAHALRAPTGGGRRVPICLDAPPACQPNLPPTQ